MSFLRTLFARLVSRTFLAGLLCGVLVGAGGLKLFAVAAMHLDVGEDDGPELARYLDPIELSNSTAATVRGTVPDGWTLRSLDGTETTFGALRKHPLLLTVGATWCEPCTAVMPTLQALHDTTGQDVHVAFVSAEPRDSLHKHVEENDYSMPAYVVNDLPSSLDGDVLPRTYLIRPDGAVVYRHVGPADWSADVVHRLLDRARSSRMAHRPGEGARRTVARRTEP